MSNQNLKKKKKEKKKKRKRRLREWSNGKKGIAFIQVETTQLQIRNYLVAFLMVKLE